MRFVAAIVVGPKAAPSKEPRSAATQQQNSAIAPSLGIESSDATSGPSDGGQQCERSGIVANSRDIPPPATRQWSAVKILNPIPIESPPSVVQNFPLYCTLRGSFLLLLPPAVWPLDSADEHELPNILAAAASQSLVEWHRPLGDTVVR